MDLSITSPDKRRRAVLTINRICEGLPDIAKASVWGFLRNSVTLVLLDMQDEFVEDENGDEIMYSGGDEVDEDHSIIGSRRECVYGFHVLPMALGHFHHMPDDTVLGATRLHRVHRRAALCGLRRQGLQHHILADCEEIERVGCEDGFRITIPTSCFHSAWSFNKLLCLELSEEQPPSVVWTEAAEQTIVLFERSGSILRFLAGCVIGSSSGGWASFVSDERVVVIDLATGLLQFIPSSLHDQELFSADTATGVPDLIRRHTRHLHQEKFSAVAVITFLNMEYLAVAESSEWEACVRLYSFNNGVALKHLTSHHMSSCTGHVTAMASCDGDVAVTVSDSTGPWYVVLLELRLGLGQSLHFFEIGFVTFNYDEEPFDATPAGQGMVATLCSSETLQIWSFAQGSEECVFEEESCGKMLVAIDSREELASLFMKIASELPWCSAADSGDMVPVIQAVEHSEPAAHVDADVAASLAAVEWADRVEQAIHLDTQVAQTAAKAGAAVASASECSVDDAVHVMGTQSGEHLPQCAEPENTDESSETTQNDGEERAEAPVAAVSPFGETIYLLRFTRTGRHLHNALDTGRALESLRDTAACFGQTCRLGSGARIFVHPDQYEDVLQSLRQHELRPHHVVVSEAFLPFVASDIGTLPSRANVRIGSMHPWAIVDGSGRVFSVLRTFIHARTDLDRSFDAATQSTSQARHIANPRA